MAKGEGGRQKMRQLDSITDSKHINLLTPGFTKRTGEPGMLRAWGC